MEGSAALARSQLWQSMPRTGIVLDSSGNWAGDRGLSVWKDGRQAGTKYPEVVWCFLEQVHVSHYSGGIYSQWKGQSMPHHEGCGMRSAIGFDALVPLREDKNSLMTFGVMIA